MAMMVVSFHGGDASKAAPVNSLATFQLGGPLPDLRKLRGFIVGTDGALYAVNGHKGNSLILRFTDLSSGWPVSFVKNFATANLSHPFDLAFGPDGDLYVSNQDSGSVTRYAGPQQPHPGSFLGTFLSGFGAVRGLANDGAHWYVADKTGGPQATGAVLMYDLAGNPQGSLAVADPIHLLSNAGLLYVGSGSGNTVFAIPAGNITAPPSKVVGPGTTPPIDGTAGLAIPGDGNRYVASRKGRQVLRYPLITPVTAADGSVFLDALPDHPLREI